ncbi:leucine-rich repeat protein [Riemerella anatipestifer]|uniref:leucine-rich repeat domain-containing protein n=1 Tax=Riemerella anatipestifer TaxID=34085 RepID=UPI0021D5A914|nr:leucine-rich repeat protein [Riemerella anatipestifer]MCU7559141.1 leucine-rich repeat protein [Riemerella anatipestifer]MDY3400712.1 leucine-rich repeat protein [Riemerella anatipestifer]
MFKKIITGITLAVSIITTHAQSFKVDGLHYRVLDESSSSVELYRDQSSQSSFTSIDGDVVIPEYVIYNGKNYQVTKIGASYFYNNTGVTSVSIPKTVIEIGSQAFMYCSSLEKVNLPYALNKIGSYAFFSCKKLKEIQILNGVSEIEKNTFSNCTSLERIILSKSVNKIDYFAFSGLYSLKEIIIENSTPPSLLSTSFANTPKDGLNTGKKEITVKVPKGAKLQYESSEEWKNFSIVEDIEVLGISNENKKTFFKVYPNPITDVFFIETEHSTPVTIYSITGKQVKTLYLDRGKNKIDILGMPQGVYIVKTDNYTDKIIVK